MFIFPSPTLEPLTKSTRRYYDVIRETIMGKDAVRKSGVHSFVAAIFTLTNVCLHDRLYIYLKLPMCRLQQLLRLFSSTTGSQYELIYHHLLSQSCVHFENTNFFDAKHRNTSHTDTNHTTVDSCFQNSLA